MKSCSECCFFLCLMSASLITEASLLDQAYGFNTAQAEVDRHCRTLIYWLNEDSPHQAKNRRYKLARSDYWKYSDEVFGRTFGTRFEQLSKRQIKNFDSWFQTCTLRMMSSKDKSMRHVLRNNAHMILGRDFERKKQYVVARNKARKKGLDLKESLSAKDFEGTYSDFMRLVSGLDSQVFSPREWNNIQSEVRHASTDIVSRMVSQKLNTFLAQKPSLEVLKNVQRLEQTVKSLKGNDFINVPKDSLLSITFYHEYLFEMILKHELSLATSYESSIHGLQRSRVEMTDALKVLEYYRDRSDYQQLVRSLWEARDNLVKATQQDVIEHLSFKKTKREIKSFSYRLFLKAELERSNNTKLRQFFSQTGFYD